MVAVSKLFNDLLFQLTPSESDLNRARQHRDAVMQRIPFPGITEFINTGSYIKGTAIRPFDDIDLFVAIDPEEYDGQPERVITRLAFHLRFSYPLSFVRAQEHSVGIQFASGVRVDVVPGFLTPEGDSYEIRNRRDKAWVPTNPHVHKDFFNSRQSQDRRFREIIRLVKHWKRQRRRRMGSYLMELLVTHWVDEEGIPDGRDAALHDFFSWVGEQDWTNDVYFFEDYYSAHDLPERASTPLVVLDPATPDNNVARNVTEEDLQSFLNSANLARRRARVAMNASSQRAAAKVWREILPGFPTP